MTSTGTGSTFTTTVRMVNRVHHNAADGRTNTAPTLGTGFSEFTQTVFFITDGTDRCTAFDENAANFTGTQTDLSVSTFASKQLSE